MCADECFASHGIHDASQFLLVSYSLVVCPQIDAMCRPDRGKHFVDQFAQPGVAAPFGTGVTSSFGVHAANLGTVPLAVQCLTSATIDSFVQ